MNFPNGFNPFTCKDFAIYVLDDYAVHLMPEVRKLLWERGYVLIIIGSGITGYIQESGTHVHRALKREYRDLKAELMLSMLQKNNAKIPSPSRDDMMKMIVTVWNKLNVDHTRPFKTLFATNSLDGSEDYLVSDRLFKLIGDSMVSFRKRLIESEIPASLPAVVKKLIPPKGIKRKNQEGYELLDFVCHIMLKKTIIKTCLTTYSKVKLILKKRVMGNHQTVATAPMKFFKMKTRPPSLMNLRLRP